MLPPELDLVVHSTHEAGAKIGGIGAVLEGILPQPAYNQIVHRTILAGPFNAANQAEMERLRAPANRLRIEYSVPDGICSVPEELARALERIELYYHVTLLYGRRRFGEVEHEVLLVDPTDVVSPVVNRFKYYLWDHYAIDSRRYESNVEYERYIGAAEPTFAALQAIAGHGEQVRPPRIRASHGGHSALIAHEWLGMPLVLSALWNQEEEPEDTRYRSLFYAHEVATVRRLVEENPGLDTRFYNVMQAARRQGLYLEDVFGAQAGFFKHALITAAAGFDAVLAVSDWTMQELRFLSPTFAARPISLIYNGIPSPPLDMAERQSARGRMQDFAGTLTGRRTDWVFTHVTRMVPSKGLWRDVDAMEQLDARLANLDERAVLFALSSALPAGRSSTDVLRWEAEYGWPVNHQADNGDLIGPEVEYYQAIRAFNEKAKACTIILVNQFGWGRDRCGTRMAAEMLPTDVRLGTDLEFGFSTYEPFGIGQLEPLAAGAVCALSSVCGSLGAVKQAGSARPRNIIVADYLSLPAGFRAAGIEDLYRIGAEQRREVELSEAVTVAGQIAERLPRTPDSAERLLADGQALSGRMSWQTVVEEELLPVLMGLW